jgi:superfamily I DNA/RNA helicase
VARAGCGKTFTLLALVRWIGENRPGQEVFLGAFNKSIAGEIVAKLAAAGSTAKASTLHSAGNSAWRKMAPNAKVTFDKTQRILKQLEIDCRNLAVGDRFAMMTKKADMCVRYASFVKKAVSLAKQRAFGFLNSIDDQSQWYAMIDHFGLEESLEDEDSVDMEHIVKLCIAVYKKGVALDYEMIDFDDMITAPLIHKVRCHQYDWVMIDEAQDTNPARRALAMKMLKPGARMVVVGDPNQAIYGFTGADNDSMDQIKAALGSIELPLNLTYRCPKAVVRLAQTWVPDIQAHESNPEGVVRTVSLSSKSKTQK